MKDLFQSVKHSNASLSGRRKLESVPAIDINNLLRIQWYLYIFPQLC